MSLRRYYFPIITRDGSVCMDRNGEEFATASEAEDHGAIIAAEIGMDEDDHRGVVVMVVDSAGNELSRHPVYRKLDG